MGKALLKGTVSGAITVFVWMMISWMFFPWHCTFINAFSNEENVSAAIMDNTKKDGIYFLPSYCDAENMSEHHQAMRKGPVVFATVQRYGFDTDSTVPYILSFIIQLIGAFLITYLLLLTGMTGYWKGVWFITLFGLTIGILGSLPSWNWLGYPIGFVGLEILDYIVSWFLASLVVSAIVKYK